MVTTSDHQNHNAGNDDEKATVISIRVTAGLKRAVVTCDSKATSVDQFQALAFDALGLPLLQLPGAEGSNCNDAAEWFVDCFPQPRRSLKPAHLSDANEVKFRQQSLYDCGLRHQDRIIVVLAAETESASKKPNGGKVTEHKSTSSNSALPLPQQRSRRKAAIAATESFAAAIQQQDEQMLEIASKADAGPAKRTNGTTPKKISSANAGSNTSRHFASLERTARNKNELGGGRRLRDGAVTASPGRKRTKMVGVNRGGDLVEGLVSSTTDASSSARLMRKGWRQAVESAYEQNQASARVAAAQSCTTSVEFTITTTESSDVAHQQQQQLKVSYKKGVQGRGVYTDVVDFIDHDVLVATISEIHPSEALRSFHLALLSPRVFWSLLYHYKNHITSANIQILGQGDVIQATLKWCCPNLDWSYLRRRPEQLSEKARENVRQKEERLNPTSTMDWEAAAAAIMSVEQSMDAMAVLTTGHDGAEAKNQNSGAPDLDSVDWTLLEHTKFDMSDLIDCINSYEIDINNDTVDYEVVFYPMNHVVYALTQKLNIQNYFELADISKNALEIYDSLTKALSDVDQLQVPVILPDDENNETVEVTSAAIEQWIESAQETAVHFSMLRICDDDPTIVEILSESLRCSTPRDLILWESVPSLCVDQVRNRWRDVAASENMTPTRMAEWERMIDEHITESNLQKWCRRAHIALEQVSWLNNFVTAIEYE